MTYELWDLASRNLVDWFEDRATALSAVRAYLDANEAGLIMLVERGEADGALRSYTGADLIRWVEAATTDARRTA